MIDFYSRWSYLPIPVAVSFVLRLSLWDPSFIFTFVFVTSFPKDATLILFTTLLPG